MICRKHKDVESIKQCKGMGEYNVCIVNQSSVGFDIFDRAIELVFGKKTTIGQICAHAKDADEDDPKVAGFCCLDAPYESVNWGEMYSCIDDKGDAKGKEACKAPGPLTSGFSPAACENFSGTWCPTPRSCGGLNSCIKELSRDAKDDVAKQAFYQYLDDAPSIEEPTSEKCADLREYFDYDRNYADDTRICEELTSLQCLDDFSNLDGFAAQGSTNGGNALVEELVMSTKIVKNTKEAFASDIAKIWGSTNYVLTKALDIFEFSRSMTSTVMDACQALPSDFAAIAAKATCVSATVVTKGALEIALFAAKMALSISERVYSEVVVSQNGAYVGAERNAIYENVITNHKNVITTFKAVQQLKQMLGEIAEDINELAEDDEDGTRRLAEVEICKDDSPCVLGECQCEAYNNLKWGKDPTKDCNCKPNYDYVKKQKGAGCDEFDSDGDGKIDNCEDRHPPTLLFANAALFKCDEANLAKHCYTEKVFLKNEYAENFLKDQMIVSDDCLIAKGLGMDISHEGTCGETVFTLNPWQYYLKCANSTTSSNEITIAEPKLNQPLPFENPLLRVKNAKQITVQVDDKDPIVTCGFHDLGDLNVEDKTLFSESGEGAGLKDANFFYTIEENCPADVKVDVTVESNEYQQEEMALLVKRKKTGVVQQAKLYFSVTSCDESSKSSHSSKSSPVCEADLSIDEKIRFYNVTVTATDSAGRVGRDTCRIIIVPNQDNRNINDARQVKRGVKSWKSNRRDDDDDFLEYIGNVTDASLELYEITSLVLLWENNLDPPEQD